MTTFDYAACGFVLHVVLGAGEQRIGAALVKVDGEAFYGYPGDVIYPKTDWVLERVGEAVAIAEYAEAEQREFEKMWAARQL